MRVLLIILVVCLSGAVAQAAPLRLTIADAIGRAVEKNLDLGIERYNPAQQEAEYQKSRGIYDPTLTFQLEYNDTTSYAAYLASSRYWDRTTQLNAAVSQLLPSGATASVGFENAYNTAGQASSMSGLANYWQSNLGITLNQPLLKNFGREPTELTIDTARLAKEVSLEQLQAKLISTVAQVRDEYYKLYSLGRPLRSVASLWN